MEKKYCSTHHLYYNGELCPFCQSEKYERMSRKHISHPTNKDNKDKSEKMELTEDVINKLRNHFSK